MGQFTAANAAEMAKRSHLPTSKRNLAPVIVPVDRPEPTQTVEDPQPAEDPFTDELRHAIEETLDELRSAKLPRDRACLARALRDLRETYHLVTGEARPGIKKHDGRAKRPVVQLEPQPASEPVPAAINAPACGVSPAPTPSPDTTR